MKKVDILVIPIANPILVGIYKNNILIDILSENGKTSDILPKLIQIILSKYNLETIFYVNSPGSYMAIKIGYIFLKTISIIKNIDLMATNGFYFNENTPIKALGKKYFFNRNGEIIIDFSKDTDKLSDFKLPNRLKKEIFTSNSLPTYNLPVIN
jgi:tRNA A37 threonylcarbamoyladenosine modification protein TsaB